MTLFQFLQGDAGKKKVIYVMSVIIGYKNTP